MPWSPETVPFIYKDDSGAPSYWFLVQIHLYALTEEQSLYSIAFLQFEPDLGLYCPSEMEATTKCKGKHQVNSWLLTF